MRKSKRLECRHDWKMRRGGRLLYTQCRICSAEVRLELHETSAHWMVSSVVISAGRGVSADELEKLSDRLYALIVDVPPVATTLIVKLPAAAA